MPDTNLSSLIWSIAELLRNDYHQSEYGRVILPFTLLRRLDQVLVPTKTAVLETTEKHRDAWTDPDEAKARRLSYAARAKVT
ncbi:MAG: type I restriction-modification system subunit M N-terminal domain-containing protein [Alkalispirochaeta sp.]